MRKIHQNVFQAWIDGEYLSEKSCSHSRGVIYSYNTPILQAVAVGAGDPVGLFELNSEKFSQTTTELQNSLRVLLEQHGLEWTERRF